MTTAPAVAVQWQAVALDVAGAAGPLALRTCMPLHTTVRAHVVIAAALGVAQTYYSAFAQWLVLQGFAVTTFDYRGHAASQHGLLRHNCADLMDWSADCLAVAQHVRGQAARLPVYWIGHSVGAQLPGATQPALPIQGLLSIASGSGYWRDNAAPTRRKVLLWWWVIAPVLTSLCGCMPGRRLGLVGDLPAGVLWQWRRWCLHPGYGIGVEGQVLLDAYAQVRYPLHAISVDDDEMMSWRSTLSLMGWYRNAQQTLERIRAQDVPGRKIGHFGFFRSEMRSCLWPRALQVLERWLLEHGAEQASHAELAHGEQSGQTQRARVEGVDRAGTVCGTHSGELYSEVP